MAVTKQFALLLWKNWLTIKRKRILTAVEIILPALFALILFLIRTRITITNYPDGRSWRTFELPDTLRKNIIGYYPDNNLTAQIVGRIENHVAIFRFQSKLEIIYLTQIQNT